MLTMKGKKLIMKGKKTSHIYGLFPQKEGNKNQRKGRKGDLRREQPKSLNATSYAGDDISVETIFPK